MPNSFNVPTSAWFSAIENLDKESFATIIAYGGYYLIHVGGAKSGQLESSDSPMVLSVKSDEYTLYEFPNFLAKPAPTLIAASTQDRKLTENLLAWGLGMLETRPECLMGHTRKSLEEKYIRHVERYGPPVVRNAFAVSTLTQYSRLIQSLR